jgi:hypothetical protein
MSGLKCITTRRTEFSTTVSGWKSLNWPVELGVLSITGVQSIRVNWLHMSVVGISESVIIIIVIIIIVKVEIPLGHAEDTAHGHEDHESQN